jgi:hypothetical protein
MFRKTQKTSNKPIKIQKAGALADPSLIQGGDKMVGDRAYFSRYIITHLTNLYKRFKIGHKK